MISAIDEPTDGALFLFGKEAQAIYQEPKHRNSEKKISALSSNPFIC